MVKIGSWEEKCGSSGRPLELVTGLAIQKKKKGFLVVDLGID